MNKRLYRNRQEGALSGVCAGLGEYLNVDKTWVRLAFVVSVIFSSMLGLGMLGPIVYIVLWIAVPVRPHTIADADPVFEPRGFYGQQYDVDYRVDPAAKQREKTARSNQDRYIAGLILLIIGVFFLLHQLDILFVHDIIQYWPVLLILSGLIVLFGAFKRDAAQAGVERETPAEVEINGEQATAESIGNSKNEENE